MSKKFTALSISALKPTDKRYEIGDIEPGLFIRVTPAGAKTFVVRYKYLGKVCRLTLGRVDDISLLDARELARDAMRKSRAGQNPAREKQEIKQAKIREERARIDAQINRMEVAIETYIDMHVRSMKSGHEVERMLRKDVIPIWQNDDIVSITKTHVLKLVASIKNRGHHSHANHVFATIRAFFNWAVGNDYGGLQISPCLGLKMPSRAVKRDRVLSDDELRLILLGTEKTDQPWGNFYRLLIHTGVRRSEASAAKWSEFDLDGEKPVWTLPSERTKNGRALVLPLAPATVEMIASIPRISNCDFLFSVTGETAIVGFSDAKERLEAHIHAIIGGENEKRGNNKRAEFAGWRIHDIRRTVATGMAGLSVAPHVVEAVLNHVSGAMSGVAGIYNRHNYYDEKKYALALWADHLVRLEQGIQPAGNVISMLK